jgi:4'-phosphopantetheinyl transferase
MAEALTIRSEEIATWPFEELNSSRFMAPNDILWPLPPDPCPLAATEVHVWAARLDPNLNALARLAKILSTEEQARASRFRFDRHRNRFITARGVLRSLLAKYLDCAPDRLDFGYGPNGKPALAGGLADSALFFNLAHSEDLALIAVTQLGQIGVDVEQIRTVTDANELVERFFSPRESALFHTLPANQKDLAFFNLWTRKEAWLKATGEGIAHSLSQVEVTFLPGEPARILALPGGSGPRCDWALRELIPATGFVGAVALPDVQFSILSFQFSIPELL